MATWSPPVRGRGPQGSPLRRRLRRVPADVAVVRGVIPHDGRPVPALVIGAFGVAAVGEMERPDRLRRVDGSWQARTRRRLVAGRGAGRPGRARCGPGPPLAQRRRARLRGARPRGAGHDGRSHPTLARVRGPRARPDSGLGRLAAAPAQHHRGAAPCPRRAGSRCRAAIRSAATGLDWTRGSSPVGQRRRAYTSEVGGSSPPSPTKLPRGGRRRVWSSGVEPDRSMGLAGAQSPPRSARRCRAG